ncbi:MAG: cache domain-containing protein [Acidobacteria bacterium]|nr:cache domain-containing protein [Acidobacteriota bacterium]
MLKKLVFIILISFIVFPVLSIAQEDSDSDIAIKLVKKAIDYVKQNGKEKAIAEICNKEGQFIHNSIYVFAYDLEGKIIAHPYKPELIGQNLLDKPDSKGKLFRKEIQKIALENGSGWVDYTYINPESNKEEQKTTYFEKYNDMIICCGIYKPIE